MGATVVATSSSDEKLERVHALGADHTINYRHYPDWGARVREWTGGFGGEIPTAHLMARQARLQGLIVGSRKHQTEFIRAIDATGIKPVIDRSFGLDEIADAFRYEASGHHFEKICLEF